MSTIIRRRGIDGSKVEIRRDAGSDRVRLFLPRTHDQVLQALAGGAASIRNAIQLVDSTIERHDHQETVYSKIGDFLSDELRQYTDDPKRATEWSRVVLPPRTGKTVIMGEVISTTATAALILVPDLTLAYRHKANLEKQLPTAKIGLLTGE